MSAVEAGESFEADVLVIGGGLSGTWAAVAAAREGASVILAESNRPAAPCTRSSRFEASEPIPLPGADSVFSSGCGAISGRHRLALSLSRRNPGDRNASRRDRPDGHAPDESFGCW